MTRRAHSPALRVEQLEDRVNPSGSVVPAGEFNWTQYSPTGELGQLVWNGGTLVYRARVADAWQETAVASSSSFTAGQYDSTAEVQKASQTAQLVFTSDGTPHALYLEKQWTGTAYRTLIQHYARYSGGWQKVETIAPPAASNWGPNNLVAEAGPNNSIHLAYTDTSVSATGVGNFGAGALWYGTNAGGGWGFNKVADTADLSQDVWFTGGRWAPRFLSMAVDAQGAAHLTYTPQFYIAGAFSTVQSTLTYATNAGGGGWRTQAVYGPQDGTADAGLGASVAVSPGGQVSIASYYVDRYNTGSPQSSQLLYHTLTNGTWSTTVVASSPDGYVAGDGARFTGFAPQLYFDAAGKANIVFSDEAGEHLPVSYANEFAGQIRLATLAGSSWSLQTVFRQSDPLHNQLLYPVAATFNGQTTFSGLQAISTLDGNRNPTSTAFSVVDVNAPRGASSPPVTSAPAPAPSPTPASAPVVTSAPQSVVPPPDGIASGWAVAMDGGTFASQVFVFRTDGSLQMTVTPFGYGYRGGVRFARADVTGDGVADVITVPKEGIEARVRVWDGVTGAMVADVVPYAGYTAGLTVAAGDVDGDGRADIAVGVDNFPIPYVSVYSGRTLGLMTAFLAYGVPLPGGVQVAMGDVNGDGYADVVTSPGAKVPVVSVFDGRGLAAGQANKFSEFVFYPPSLQVGVNIAVGDMDGDGYADVLGGASSTIAHVQAFSGRALSRGQQVTILNVVTADGANPGGARVGLTDADGDGRTDLVTTGGTGNGGRIAVYADPADNSTSALRLFDPLPSLSTGLYVG